MDTTRFLITTRTIAFTARSTDRARGFASLVIAAALAFALALVPARSSAEDIDLYATASSTTTAPNVLFFIDNSSNWSANSQAWKLSDVRAKCNAMTDATKKTACLSYATEIFGTNTSLVQGQVELRALKLVLNRLVCASTATLKVNVGLMLYNTNGTVDGNSVMSGYIRRAIAPMDSTRCATFLADLDNIDSKITTPDFKGPSSAEYGAPLYEAFKYFGGHTNPANASAGTAGTPADSTHFGPVRYGLKTDLEDSAAFADSARTTYKSPLTADAHCGNNYIILIGNTWPNQEWGTRTNVSPDPTNTLLSRLGYQVPQIYPTPLLNSDKSDVRFGDEWAQFLYNTDISPLDGKQNLQMFTVDVWNASADTKQGALLKSMAGTNGPSGYFSVGGDLYGLIAAFTDMLTQVAAVNSVFSSVSLPISVNAQGTFLNQVFIGLFRPDGAAGQRWPGNLKQYRFAKDKTNGLYLADATVDDLNKPRGAIDSKNTGFLQNCATSFWTSDSGTYWSTVAGFNQPSGCNTSLLSPYSDAPDGPLVERGGAAQRLRLLGHAARNLRTCADAACTSLIDFDAAHAANTTTGLSATLVNWVRGQNTGDGSLNAAGTASSTNYGLAATATRPTVHGEVVHSRPLAVNYGSGSTNDVVVFYGAGDGVLRAINGNASGSTAGNELWGFVAPEHWSKLDRVRTDSPLIAYPNVPSTLAPTPTPKTYFFDGSIGGYQEVNSTGVTRLWVYPTMRRGGDAVYAFDATAKPGSTSQPTLLWKFSGASNTHMGQSWSTPLAIRIKGRTAPLVVFGAGYDACEDAEDPNTACASVVKGRGVFVMSAQGGSASEFRLIDPGSEAGRFAADIAAVDIDGDGFIDVLYAVDTRGNVWRINTSDPSKNFTGYASINEWPWVKVASVGQWGASLTERRKFLSAPNVAVFYKASANVAQTLIQVGSGDREKPLWSSNAAQVLNRFYGIRDNIGITTNGTGTGQMTAVTGYGDSPSELKNVTDLEALDPTALVPYRGWYRNLYTTAAPYEQVVTTPLTMGGVTYFNTYQASSPSDTSCTNLGTGRGYQIDFQTGSKLAGVDLMKEFLSKGIPPPAVGGPVVVDGEKLQFCVGCPASSPQEGTELHPKIKPNRKPIYRYQRIDN